jgi:hypothetical protein
MLEDEWTNVEHIPLYDVLFHGYEVLTNPPFLSLVEHFFYAISTNPWVYRLPIAAFGVALVFGVHRLGRELLDLPSARLAALLCAVHPGLIVWSQTVRGYLPAACFIIWTAVAGWRLLKTGRDRDALALGLFGALASWTHYTAVFALVPLFILLLAEARRNRAHLLRLLLAGGAMVLAFLPLVPYCLSGVDIKQGSGFIDGYTPLMVAFVSGIPLQAGWLVIATVFCARPWRHNGERRFLLLCLGLVASHLLTSPYIYQIPPYAIALTAFFQLLAAAVITRLSRIATHPGRQRALALLALPLLATTCTLQTAPAVNDVLAAASEPFLFRPVGHGAFAARIEALSNQPDASMDCDQIVTSHWPEQELYLYHLGGLTRQDMGLQPIIEQDGTTFRIALATASGKAAIFIEPLRLPGAKRVTRLQATVEQLGCFFYADTGQNCATGRGSGLDPAACDWLGQHCQRVTAYAREALYLCKGPPS